jgi:hypothetical protein
VNDVVNERSMLNVSDTPSPSPPQESILQKCRVEFTKRSGT